MNHFPHAIRSTLGAGLVALNIPDWSSPSGNFKYLQQLLKHFKAQPLLSHQSDFSGSGFRLPAVRVFQPSAGTSGGVKKGPGLMTRHLCERRKTVLIFEIFKAVESVQSWRRAECFPRNSNNQSLSGVYLVKLSQ